MDNLVFALNATVPLFVVMLLGSLFKKAGFFDDTFVSRMNSFVFRIALPTALFYDLASEDFVSVWDTGFVVFCFTVTAICIAAAILIAKLLGGDITGEFAQTAYRSSAAILGIGFMQNLYGNAGMSPLMIAATVPLYNIMAVVILSVFRPGGGRFTLPLALKTLKDIVTNPIIIGIIAGTLWSVLALPKPAMLMTTVRYISNVSTPMGLMALGASVSTGSAGGYIKPAFAAAALKLVIWCAVFLPLAVLLGFRTQKLVAILVMLGSPSTVSCFIMARNMGHEGHLTSVTVMLTTLLSAFTLTGWLCLLRSMGFV